MPKIRRKCRRKSEMAAGGADRRIRRGEHAGERVSVAVRFLNERITCKLADAARLQDMATRITPILREDGVSGGGGAPDRLADAVAKIVDLKAEINRDIDRLVDKKRDIAAKLGKLTDRRYYAVLFRRYLLFETFEKISCEMNYSWRHVCSLHGQALEAFQKVLDAEKDA